MYHGLPSGKITLHFFESLRMSITITDPALLAQLRQAGGAVELKDPEGNVLGIFVIEGLGKLPPRV